MRHIAVVMAAAGWAASVLLAAQQGVAPGGDQPPDPVMVARHAALLPEGKGREAALRICGSECHTAETFAGRSSSSDDWDLIMQDMIARGAQVTDEEYGEILDYLARQFPEKYSINALAASALTTRFKFSPSEAAAIVAYREANGIFMSIEELRKVPGVAKEKIDAVQRQLRFGPP